MDWQGGRIGRPPAELLTEIVAWLSAVREAGTRDADLGLLLHHRDHDETVWSFLATFLNAAAHPAVTLVDPGLLLAPPLAESQPKT